MTTNIEARIIKNQPTVHGYIRQNFAALDSEFPQDKESRAISLTLGGTKFQVKTINVPHIMQVYFT